MVCKKIAYGNFCDIIVIRKLWLVNNMKVAHIQKLQKAYREKRLIPFIGAGLSAPFKIPTWGEMIEIIASKYVDPPLIPSIKHYISKQDYWNAIDSIKEFGEINEMTLQKEICDIIKERLSLNKQIKNDSHNYSDLASLNVLNYLTTNYDFLLYEFLPTKTTIPQVLHKVDISSQLFFEDRKEPKIWHLHGHIDDYGSIVFSREKYEELYSNSKYVDFFKIFQGNGVLLFIGFSFNDYYIQDLLKRNNRSFNSEHFIILDNPTPEAKRKFINEFGINVIEYNSENNTKHAECIRKIINKIKDENDKEETKDIFLSLQDEPEDEEWPELLSNDRRKEMENNLFCKKIRIEKIDEITLDYSKDCFFWAEELIRKLRKKGFSYSVIYKILNISYMKYMEVKNSVYKHGRNSQVFIDKVHEVLAGMNIDEINLVSRNEMCTYQKQGTIHIIADEKKYNVWWGENRINEK